MQFSEHTRVLELDFVKGLLVLTMVIYHTFVKFFSHSGWITSPAKFVSGGFVYISGFLISYHYLDRYVQGLPGIRKRLFIRGLKIFFIFFFANIGFFYSNKFFFIKYLRHIIFRYYIIGSGNSYFEILLPISYLLFFSCLFLPLLKRENKYFLNCLIIFIFILVSIEIIETNTNSIYVLCGISGIINALLANEINLNSNILKALVFSYFLGMGGYRIFRDPGRDNLLYLLYIIAALYVFYFIGLKLRLKEAPSKYILLIGRYSLFAYIYHLCILEGLRRFISIPFIGLELNCLIVVFVSLILIITCHLLDIARGKIVVINKFYRSIFA